MRLEGKTALITAAGQGMGRATAAAFMAEGARVWATDIDAAKVADIDGAEGFKLDATSAEDVAAAAARTGAVDILFNCAGYVAVGTVLDCEPDDWDRSFNINVRSMYLMARAYLPLMIANGGGRVLNMASVAGQIKGIPDRAAYGATKAAVIGLTKSIAADYIGDGIRCNAICPGTVETPSLQDRIDAFDDPVEARKMFVGRQPMGRLARAEEVAELCVYLASDASEYMTGQAVIIDGGITI